MSTKARIATVCQGRHFYPSIQKNREYVLSLLDLALTQKPDLVCLPETFTTVSLSDMPIAELAEPVPGPTVDAAAAKVAATELHPAAPTERTRLLVIDDERSVLHVFQRVFEKQDDVQLPGRHDLTAVAPGGALRTEFGGNREPVGGRGIDA